MRTLLILPPATGYLGLSRWVRVGWWLACTGTTGCDGAEPGIKCSLDTGCTIEAEDEEDDEDGSCGAEAALTELPTDADGLSYPLLPWNWAWQDYPIETPFHLNPDTNFTGLVTDGNGAFVSSTEVENSWLAAVDGWLNPLSGASAPDLVDPPPTVDARGVTNNSNFDGRSLVYMSADTGLSEDFAYTSNHVPGSDPCAIEECDTYLRQRRWSLTDASFVSIDWVTSDSTFSEQMSITATFAHEWGHCIGLEHFDSAEYSFENSIMQTVNVTELELSGIPWTGVSDDDLGAAVYIYGPE